MSEAKVFVPPIKIQGIKTKIVPLIKENVLLTKDTVWVEPFMGSGVVGFNVAPHRAVFADKNPYIIDFYNGIRSGDITSGRTKSFLKKKKASCYRGMTTLIIMRYENGLINIMIR